MHAVDWTLFVAFLAYVIWDGARRARQSHSEQDFFLAGRQAPWWLMGLSIMATQASAITMIATTGKGWREGMPLLQFYMALPLAMLILIFTLVPLFHRLQVFTAYEYLGRRFDGKTRLLSALLFLLLRGLSCGVIVYAPSAIFALLFDVPIVTGVLVMGLVAMLYTTAGGMRAVLVTDAKQMIVMLVGLLVALGVLITRIPEDVGLGGALNLAEAAGRLRLFVFDWEPTEKYNVPSALLGGTCLFLAYFGTDQSQVQRYLAGRSLRDSQWALGLNALCKVPFQALVLLTGVLLFVFYLFEAHPVSFSPLPDDAPSPVREAHEMLEARHQEAHQELAGAARAYLADPGDRSRAGFQAAVDRTADLRAADHLLWKDPALDVRDEVQFVFPRFVLDYLPVGLVGLLFAAFLAAALSSIDSELNALATVTVRDLYEFGFRRTPAPEQAVWISRLGTVFWGLVATGFALTVGDDGDLIDTVNQVGSFFYGPLLGVFALAALPWARGHGAFAGLVAGMGAVVLVYDRLGDDQFLLLNTVGAVTVPLVGSVVSWLWPGPPRSA